MNACHLSGKCRNLISDCGGVSLVELLVSMAILAIVSIPFLGSFITAEKNNTSSKYRVFGTVSAQKAMDDIKSRPLFLYAMSGQGNKVYSSDGDYRVECRVTEEQTVDFADYNDGYNFNMSDPTFSQEFRVGSDSVMLNGFSYNLLDGETTKKYYLSIAMNELTGQPLYTFYDNVDTVLQSGELTADEAINERICFDKTGSGRLELHVTVDPSVDRAVNLYTVDDLNSGMLLINDGDVPVNLYCCVSNDQESFVCKLFRIELFVYKGSELVNNLVSFVKK